MPAYSVEVRGWVDVTCDSPQEAMDEVDGHLSFTLDIQNLEVVSAQELTPSGPGGMLTGGEVIYRGES